MYLSLNFTLSFSLTSKESLSSEDLISHLYLASDCRLGATLYSFHSSILNCLLPQLTSPRLAVRKRAIIALGHLVLTCNGNIFSELMEHLLAELKRNESTSTTRTYIQCIAGISRQAGHRIGKTSHLE